MSSSPNGPPVAYANITKTSGSSPALRTSLRFVCPLLASLGFFVRISSAGPRAYPAKGIAFPFASVVLSGNNEEALQAGYPPSQNRKNTKEWPPLLSLQLRQTKWSLRF